MTILMCQKFKSINFKPLMQKPNRKLLNWISISAPLMELLTAQRQSTGLQGYVFINPKTGKPYGDRRKTLDTLCRKAGVKRFTLHCVRHLGASLMAESGEALVHVQARLRHKNLTTTQRYLHQITAVEMPKVISSLSSELRPDHEKSRLSEQAAFRER
ncbi:MAG: hypothetical protein EOM37_16830 [Proteobacteria bacterium]|nr:hypothetical protein [Pseudomonadota bacterium]